jgi:hypothetical protein
VIQILDFRVLDLKYLVCTDNLKSENLWNLKHFWFQAFQRRDPWPVAESRGKGRGSMSWSSQRIYGSRAGGAIIMPRGTYETPGSSVKGTWQCSGWLPSAGSQGGLPRDALSGARRHPGIAVILPLFTPALPAAPPPPPAVVPRSIQESQFPAQPVQQGLP